MVFIIVSKVCNSRGGICDFRNIIIEKEFNKLLNCGYYLVSINIIF